MLASRAGFPTRVDFSLSFSAFLDRMRVLLINPGGESGNPKNINTQALTPILPAQY